jgi:hypothetical protein
MLPSLNRAIFRFVDTMLPYEEQKPWFVQERRQSSHDKQQAKRFIGRTGTALPIAYC